MIKATFLVVGLLALVISSAGTVSAGKGGPDAGGYSFLDNADQAGPFFNFGDISSAALDIGSNCDDCVVSNQSIGFPFVFYGQTFTTMNISSNGNIQFETTNAAFGNPALPAASFGRMIAPYFDDLQTNCTSTDAIFSALTGQPPNRIRIVQWRMTPHFPCQQGDITFQVILYESTNHIQFNYPDVVFVSGSPDNNGASATVGIQRDSSVALQYSFNSAVINNGLAICYTPATPTNVVCNRPVHGPNVSGAIGAIVAGADGTRDNLARQAQVQGAAQQSAAAAATAAQQAAQPSAGLLRPPSTGDAGLLGQDRSREGVAFLIVAVGLTMASLGFAWGRVRVRGRY